MKADVIYEIGDEVVVDTPNGKICGRVVSVIPDYAWSGETKYSVHGDEFVTITSARTLKLRESGGDVSDK